MDEKIWFIDPRTGLGVKKDEGWILRANSKLNRWIQKNGSWKNGRDN